MPKHNLVYKDYNYAITITFKPYYSVSQKFKLIEELHKFISSHFSTNNTIYSIEYHKYNIKDVRYDNNDYNDNPLKPHVHMIVQCKRKRSVDQINNIYKEFQRTYGNTKIDYLESKDDFDNFSVYLLKDVDRLDNKFDFSHFHSFNFNSKKDFFNLFKQDFELDLDSDLEVEVDSD